MAGRFRVGEWLVDSQLDELSRYGEVVKLEPRMVRLLAKLAEHPGQVISTKQLLDSVWSGVVVGPASVYQAVSSLRKQLGDTDPTPTYIATIPRKGYRLIAPVEFEGAPTPGAPVPPAPNPRRVPWILAATGLAVAIVAALWFGLSRRYEGTPPQATSAPAVASDRPSLAMAAFDAGGMDEESLRLASAMRELLHNRLITQNELILLSLASTEILKTPNADLRELSRRINARFLLRGRTKLSADLLHVDLNLLEPASGQTVWSQTFVKHPAHVTALREQIVAAIADRLGVRIGPEGNVPIDLGAYQLLVRGMEVMAPNTEDAYRASYPVFVRATVVYPDFARAHLFVGHVLMLQTNPEAEHEKRQLAAEKAYQRAVVIDPGLGEAWIGIAETLRERDRAAAEDLFNRGMALSPSYTLGHFKYGMFLFSNRRPGEAISQIQAARRLDPVSVMPALAEARIWGHTRGDVARHDQIVREIVEVHPKNTMAHDALAFSRYAWGGAFAEAAQLVEKVRALDRNARIAALAAAIYLDLDDVADATAMGAGDPIAQVQIARFRQQPAALERFSNEDLPWLPLEPMGYTVAEALRDQAAASGKFASSLERLEVISTQFQGPQWMLRKYLLLQAHTQVLSGQVEQGHELALSTIKLLEHETVGRPPHWYARDFASAYAILGDYERALAELQHSQAMNDYTRWWYTAELDPLFAPLRNDPRFRALVEAARQHEIRQRALLEEMRRRGEIPRRAA